MSSISQDLPHQAIEQMIDLRIQLEEIERQIQAFKPAFYKACEQLENNQIHHEKALIYYKVTSGKWVYPDNLIKQQQKLKQLKLAWIIHEESRKSRKESLKRNRIKLSNN